MLTATRRKIKIGPQDHGRKMSLKNFEFAETLDGYIYELSRGYITVGQVANLYHALIVGLIRRYLDDYHTDHLPDIFAIFGGAECKLLMPEWDSERHPDIAVYLTKPKGKWDSKLWRRWFPEFLVEVVSARSEHRDYFDKREEYWTLGVKEYWIVDAPRQLVICLRRGKSDWKESRLGPDDVCTTKLLPGFKLPCKPIFELAAEAGVEEE